MPSNHFRYVASFSVHRVVCEESVDVNRFERVNRALDFHLLLSVNALKILRVNFRSMWFGTHLLTPFAACVSAQCSHRAIVSSDISIQSVDRHLLCLVKLGRTCLLPRWMARWKKKEEEGAVSTLKMMQQTHDT